MVHCVLDGSVQRLLELLLADIVLILSDTDCLWVDLDKLCERILHAPCDGDCTANRDIVVGQLILCELGGGVDGGTRLVRDEIVNGIEAVLTDQCGDELLCFVGSSAVADRDERDSVRLDELQQCLCRRSAFAVASCHMDHAARKDVARCVDECHFAARAIAGVKPENGMPCERRLQEELTKVVSEHGDCLFLGGFGQAGTQLALKCGDEQTLVAVLNRRT